MVVGGGAIANVYFNRYSFALRLSQQAYGEAFGASKVEMIPDPRGRITGLRLTTGDMLDRPLTNIVNVEHPYGEGRAVAQGAWQFSNMKIPGGLDLSIALSQRGVEVKGLKLTHRAPLGRAELWGMEFKAWTGADYPRLLDRLVTEAPKTLDFNHNLDFYYSMIGSSAHMTAYELGAKKVPSSGNKRREDAYRIEGVKKQATTPDEVVDEIVRWANGSIVQPNSLQGFLFAKMKEQFLFGTDIDTDILPLIDLIELNFGEAIAPFGVRFPMDAMVAGLIAPKLTAFRIDPLESVLAAGGKHKFEATPPNTNIVYTLDDPRRSGKLGDITLDGHYTAPEADQFDGLFTHVRVLAEHKQTGHRSAALVTVLKDPIIVNPLIDSTAGIARTLKAGFLGGGGQQLTWSIKKTGTEGSLSSTTGNTVTYTPSKNFGTDPNTIFVVDEVTVSNGKDSATAYIVNRKIDPVNVIAYTVNTNNTVRCQATVNGNDIPAKWKILVGPGDIDDSGLYTADTASTKRFVLIHSRATAETEFGTLVFEGYLILPLPLAKEDRVLPGTVEVSSAGEILREIRPMG